MSSVINIYDNCCPSPPAPPPLPPSAQRTKQLRVTFGNQSGTHVSGPFTESELNDAISAFAVRSDVVKIEVEDV